MSNRKALAVVLLVIAVIGLAIGLWPRSVVTDIGTTQSCGSAFAPSTDGAEVKDLAAQMRGETSSRVADCDAELSGARTLALVLIGGAVLGGLGLALTKRQPALTQAPGPGR